MCCTTFLGRAGVAPGHDQIVDWEKYSLPNDKCEWNTLEFSCCPARLSLWKQVQPGEKGQHPRGLSQLRKASEDSGGCENEINYGGVDVSTCREEMAFKMHNHIESLRQWCSFFHVRVPLVPVGLSDGLTRCGPWLTSSHWLTHLSSGSSFLGKFSHKGLPSPTTANVDPQESSILGHGFRKGT